MPSTGMVRMITFACSMASSKPRPSSTSPSSKAFAKCFSFRSTPNMRPIPGLFLKARAVEPPIKPTPTIAIFISCKGIFRLFHVLNSVNGFVERRLVGTEADADVRLPSITKNTARCDENPRIFQYVVTQGVAGGLVGRDFGPDKHARLILTVFAS